MAITFDDNSAPTQGAEASVGTGGSSCDLTAVADRRHLVVTASGKAYFRRSSGGAWILLPAETPRVIYEVGALDTLYYKADSGTVTIYVEVLSPDATTEGRG